MPSLYKPTYLFGCLCAVFSPFCQASSPSVPPTITLLLGEHCDDKGYVLPIETKRQKLITLIGTEAGIKFDIKAYPWRRAQKLAERGKGLLWGISKTPERARHFIFSEPVFTSRVWMIVPTGQTFSYQSIQDLLGKRIAITGGAQYEGDFEAHRGTLFTVEEGASTLSTRLAMLTQGRVDMVLLGTLHSTANQFETWLNSSHHTNGGPWSVLKQPLLVEPAHIAAARNYSINQYLPAIDQAIIRLRQRGLV